MKPGAVLPSPEVVVVLHGVGRTRWSMAGVARSLARDGYCVVNLSYPSRTKSLATLAGTWLPQQLRLAEVARAPRFHFVAHSMAGLVVRLWVQACGAPANLGRVVMLAPPNAGSEITDRLRTFPPYRWAVGVNALDLGTDATALPRTLGPWPRDAGQLGIIAGDMAINPLLASFVPAPNDGKVSVNATHLTGEQDHVVVPFSHTWLGWRRESLGQIRAFLRTGQFERRS